MKEGLFFSCTAILLLFQGFYLMVNPSTAWAFGIGGLIGFVALGIALGVLSGITAVTVGLSETANRIIFITASIINLMFQLTLDVWIGPFHVVLPVGMGILYPNAWGVFATNTGDVLGYFGFLFITGMALIVLICGLLMGAGTGD